MKVANACVVVTCAFLLAMLTWYSRPQAQAEDSNNYMGSEACAACHADSRSDFRSSAHSVTRRAAGRGKLAINNRTCGDGDAGPMSPVLRMEVRWHMVEPIDCDTNSVKTADLGHAEKLFLLTPTVKSEVQAAGGFLDRSLQQYRIGGNLHFSAISAADASEGFEKTSRIGEGGYQNRLAPS